MAFAIPALALVGGAFGAAGSATAAAAVGASVISAGVGAASTIVSGIGQYQQAAYQAEVAKRNAAIAGQAASQSLISGQQTEEQTKLRTGQEVAQAEAASAARGVDVNSGSPEDFRSSIQETGDIDAATQHYNALKQAYGYDMQQQQFLADRKNYQSAGTGALVGSLFKAGGSLIGSAASIGGQMAAFQQSGALTGGGGLDPMSLVQGLG